MVKYMTVAEIAYDLEVSELTVTKSISPIQLAFLQSNEKNSVEKKFSDEECLEALRTAQTYAFPLTAKTYSKLISKGEVVGPSTPLIYNRFGSWATACQLAGVESGEAVRDNYDRQYTDSEILQYVRRFLYEQEDANWTIAQYVKWREFACEEAPSMALIRKRIGSWPMTRVKAILLKNSPYSLEAFEKVFDYE